MSLSADKMPGLRLPTWTWVLLFVITAPLTYFCLRESSRQWNDSWSGNIFLIVLSGLIAWNYHFALKNREAILATLPEWLRPYWVRFGIYFAAGMGLTAGVNVLQLPSFYDSVLSRSVLFFLLPYLLTARRSWSRRFSEKADSVDPIVADSDADLIFSYSRKRAFFLVMGGLVFVAAGIWMRHAYPVIAWTTIGFFGLAIPLGLLMCIPGCTCLILRKDDFIMVHTWRRYALRWIEVSDFAVVEASGNVSCVGFNFSATASDQGASWRKRIARRKWVRDTYGKDMLLSAQYDVSTTELCRVMKVRRDRALADFSSGG